MITLITQLMPVGVLLLNVASVVLLGTLITHRSWGRGVAMWTGRNAVVLGFLVALGAMAGSLFYSNVVGFAACNLCWWQRIFLYPLVIIFPIALSKKDKGVFSYAAPLALLSTITSIYQSYIQWGGNPLIPCDLSASCTKLYVYAYGYITIPTMSLSIGALILLLAWADRIYQSSR